MHELNNFQRVNDDHKGFLTVNQMQIILQQEEAIIQYKMKVMQRQRSESSGVHQIQIRKEQNKIGIIKEAINEESQNSGSI